MRLERISQILRWKSKAFLTQIALTKEKNEIQKEEELGSSFIDNKASERGREKMFDWSQRDERNERSRVFVIHAIVVTQSRMHPLLMMTQMAHGLANTIQSTHRIHQHKHSTTYSCYSQIQIFWQSLFA